VANVHSQAQREFIVKSLAAFKPPRAIVADFSALFPDTKCDENDVKRNDPKLVLIAPDLTALFFAERERVLLDPTSAPFADQRARIKALNEQAEFYLSNNQFPEARTVLRQIAEEQGVVGGKGVAKVAGRGASDTPEFKSIEVTRTVVDPVPQSAA
jgi:hypothetical protein